MTSLKIISLDSLPQWREQLRAIGQRLVVTNGVFDLLHPGHAQYLRIARSLGDALLVCINDDDGVKALKGPTRPLLNQDDRACMLAALESVSAVTIFAGCKATEVLRLAQPDIYVKGGDYSEDSLDREEYAILKQTEAQIRFVHFVGNFSTSNSVRKINAAAAATTPEQKNSRLDFIYARRSIRKYQPRPVAAETLRELVRAGMAAPSACAKNPWEFIVVTEKEILATIAGFLPNGKFLAEAAAGILLCGNLQKAHAGELSYLLQDCTAAIENILLAANALGLGACWLGVHPRPERIEKLQSFCQLPENILPIACLAIGWPDEEKSPRTNFQEEALHWQRW